MVKLILRKPYAFLIKHFRIIHGLIFIMMIYLFTKSISIYSFFSDYATKHYFTPEANLVNNYINIRMFVISILTVLLTSVVYYLLSIKNKNRRTYFFICFYYILLFVYFLYYHNVLVSLEDNILSTETVRVLRDISLIALIPQLILMIIILLRTLGFNLKQFEFKSDLEDLQIDKSDYEEIEVTLGKNNYKYKRLFRKGIRYFKYFLAENKFFITIMASIIVLSISIITYINIKVINIAYYENQSIYANTLWYTVENSYITNESINGSIINNDKYYVLVKVKMENKSSVKYDLSRDLFRLKVNNDLLIPIFNMDREFLDIGKIYTPMSILGNSTEEVVLVFEINENNLKNEYVLKIKNNENVNISSESERYKDIIIRPVNFKNTTESNSYNLPANIEFNNSLLNETKMVVSSYIIDYSFKEKSKYCLNEKCYDKVVIIEPTNLNSVVMKLKTNLEVDENIYMKKYLDSASSLIEYYGKIKYRYLGENYETNIIKIMNNNLDNTYSYLEVPNKLLEADKIELILNVRGKSYTIVLK